MTPPIPAPDRLSSTTAGRALARVRHEAGWTLRELARRAGVTAATLSSIERGRPAQAASLRRLLQVVPLTPAEVLGVPVLCQNSIVLQTPDPGGLKRDSASHAGCPSA